MQILLITSKLDPIVIPKKLEKFDAVAVRTGVIMSIEELRLADYLAKQAFTNKKNIANKFKYEFLLWLAGKRDIKSAIEETNPNENTFIVIVFSGDADHILEVIDAKKLELKIKKDAEPSSIEKIALSRLK
ncbi:MAG: KEOPS complex subunit Cgi121 [Candidatus Micrarchaeota archaeon]